MSRSLPLPALVAVLAASFVSACGDDGTTPAHSAKPTDASADVQAPDGGPDSADASVRDVVAEGAPDAGLDAPIDVSVEADALIDAGEDASPDGSAGPSAPCTGPGGGGHVKLVAAYWASTDAFGDHLSELVPAMHAGHVDLLHLAQPLPSGVDVIVDLHWELFDYTSHTVRADIATRLDGIAAAAAPVLGRVRAFYLIDEPYIDGHLIPRSELEKAIAAVNARFPGVPTYITFAHHCFDPSSADPACVIPSAERGIPAGLDWVGFDWYNDSNDLANAATHVPTHVATGVDRIAQLAPTAKVIVVPEAYTDGNRVEATVVSTLHDYFALCAQNPSVFGVDFFLWADVPPPENFLGLQSLPSARAATRSFARWVRKECGETADLIPVTQWYTPTGPDYRYEPWVWDGRSSGYRVDGVAFALPPATDPGAIPLVHCLVDRGSSVDSYLTTDAGCDSAPVVSPGVVIGGIFAAEQPGTVQLHRYAQQQAPWDHVYTLSASAALPASYAYEWPIGWVYPPSAL